MTLPKGNKEEQLSKYNLFANHSAANPATTKSNQHKSCFRRTIIFIQAQPPRQLPMVLHRHNNVQQYKYQL